MAPNPRVAKAFRAMRELGIVEETVKPVLKNLLKLYEKNWQLIEEENYRALADAIFDQAETQENTQKRKNGSANLQNMEEEAQVNEEPERPLKRLRLRHQEGHASPSVGNTSSRQNGTLLKQPKEEAVELPDETSPCLHLRNVAASSEPTTENGSTGSRPGLSPPLVRNKGKQPMLHDSSSIQGKVDASQSNAADRTLQLATNGTGSDLLSSNLRHRDKGKEPMISQIPLNCDRSSHTLHLKEPKVEPSMILSPKKQADNSNALIKPKDEPVVVDAPHLAVPLAVINPEPSNAEMSSRANDILRRSCSPELLGSWSVHDKERSDAVPALSNDRNTNCEVTNIVNESSRLEVTFPEYGEETIDITPAIDMGKHPNGANASVVREKPIGPDNGPIGSQHVVGVAYSRIPSHLSSNRNDCSVTINGTDELIFHVDKELNDLEHVSSHNHVVQQRQSISNDGKPLHDVVDISKGQEKIVISFVNEVNDECLPSFRYIPQNVIFQNAYINFSLARIGENCCSTCAGDCLLSSIPCACANESGGEYAYTSEGLVKEDILNESVSMNRDPEKHCHFYCSDCPLERSKNDDIVEPCKGHLVRRFIKECWWKCGCSKQCGNRVVQRGINRKLQVFMTPEGKGWGLRTLEDLPKGAFVCEYVGEILTNAELFERVSQRQSGEEHAYPVLLDADWGAEGVLKDEEALCLDATHYGNVGRFVNHRCFDSNMVEIPVEVETPDHHYYHLAFFTNRKVKALEELTWDYGIDFDDNDHPVKAFKCRCGSKFCRNMKRSNRSRRRRRYA